ncbi:MAG: PH domain-containing protein [Planctomycetota bacterium]
MAQHDQPELESSARELPGSDAIQINLGEGEDLLLRLSPHWIFVLIDRWPVLAGALTVAGGGLVGAEGLTRVVLVATPVVWVLWQFIERASRTYVLTTRRVVMVAGVLRQIVVDAPLANVRQVSVFRSIPERVLGLGTVAFATAGTGGQDIIWRIVDHPRSHLLTARQALDRAEDRAADRAVRRGGGHGE